MDITTLFKSKVRKALFGLYFTDPEKTLYLRQLERELSIPVAMLRRELQALEKAGIFQATKDGNRLYYALNIDYPLYNELKIIVAKTIGVQALLKNTLSSLVGVTVAFIYGSFARGNEQSMSDIDLFIIGDIDEYGLIEKIKEAEKKLRREINYTLYRIHDYHAKKKAQSPFIVDVLVHPKLFLIGSDDGL